MDKMVMEKIKKLFPELLNVQQQIIYRIYLEHVDILKIEGVNLTGDKIKSIMDTVTYSVKNTLNLGKI